MHHDEPCAQQGEHQLEIQLSQQSDSTIQQQSDRSPPHKVVKKARTVAVKMSHLLSLTHLIAVTHKHAQVQ